MYSSVHNVYYTPKKIKNQYFFKKIENKIVKKELTKKIIFV